jgi:transcriptional regulator with XRE-family HTH domain
MSEDVRCIVGRNVRRLRGAAGLSQAKLAERMGVDRAYVSGLESAPPSGDGSRCMSISGTGSSFGLTVRVEALIGLLVSRLGLERRRIPTPRGNEMVVITGCQPLGRRLNALAMAGPDQPRHVKAATFVRAPRGPIFPKTAQAKLAASVRLITIAPTNTVRASIPRRYHYHSLSLCPT